MVGNASSLPTCSLHAWVLKVPSSYLSYHALFNYFVYLLDPRLCKEATVFVIYPYSNTVLMGYSLTWVIRNDNQFLSFRVKNIFFPLSVPTPTNSALRFISDAASSTGTERYSAKPQLYLIPPLIVRLVHVKRRYDKAARAYQLL